MANYTQNMAGIDRLATNCKKYADQAYDFMRDAAANDAVILFVVLETSC